jgi:hypothetical protein
MKHSFNYGEPTVPVCCLPINIRVAAVTIDGERSLTHIEPLHQKIIAYFWVSAKEI